MRHSLATFLVIFGSCLTGVPVAAQQVVYTADTHIGDFTSRVSSYATFSNFTVSDGPVTSPFTPTSAELASNGFHVVSGGSLSGLPQNNNWILATFSSPVFTILVFPNIDHRSSSFDGYQYSIYGSNDGLTWTALFDALSVINSAGPAFTLGAFTGTAPTSVNNVVTGGCTPDGDCVGYEAQFTFPKAYRFYAFGASTEAINAGNSGQELSGVGAVAISVKEPLDGDDLLQMCQLEVEQCEGYIEGITDLLANFCPRREEMRIRNDWGREEGRREVLCADCNSLRLCLPAELQLSQLRTIVLTFLTDHSDLRARRAAQIVISALATAYPCRAD